MKLGVDVKEFCQRLGHQFSRPELLLRALTHSSISSETRPDNQRLEFLGDRVLGLVMAEALFKALSESKKWALEQMRFSGAQRYMLPWLFDDIDEMDELFGGDPCPYGVEPNRKTLETAIDYLVDQGFTDAPMEVDELFTPIVGWEE